MDNCNQVLSISTDISLQFYRISKLESNLSKLPSQRGCMDYYFHITRILHSCTLCDSGNIGKNIHVLLICAFLRGALNATSKKNVVFCQSCSKLLMILLIYFEELGVIEQYLDYCSLFKIASCKTMN